MLPSRDVANCKDKVRLKVKRWKCFCKNKIHRKAGVAILRQNKFQGNKGNKRQRWTFYNDKEDTTSRKHNTS